jgi:outer membrane protein
MTRSRWKWIVTAALAASVTAPARAQETSEARIQELIRLAAERVANGQAGTPVQTPTQTAPSPGDTRPVIRLTLDDAVKLALDRNLDIAVQRLNPQLSDIQIASLTATYRPSITSQLGGLSQLRPVNTTLSGNSIGVATETGQATYNGGLAQNLPWGGGGFNINLNNNRVTTNNTQTYYNPTFNTNWAAQYTPPLLRGFKIDSTRQQIQVTKLNRDISDIQLRSAITNTLSNVRNAYWDYVFAVQAVEVSRESLDLANRLVQDNQTRVQVGTMAPIDVVQAQSEAATRRQTLVTAEATKRTTELALKRLIVNGTQDPNWNASIDPTDRPEFRPEAIDTEAAVRRALSERTDLEIVKKNVQANDVTLRLLRNQTLPQADVVAQYGLIGIGGTQLLKTGSGIPGSPTVITGTVPGGYLDALSSLWNGGYPQWNVALNLTFPLGLSSQEAAVARARVQLSQVQEQIKQAELQVATDVTNAAITVQNTAEGVQAAQASRELAQQKLQAEQSKFEVGMSTNYFVVQAQRDLSDAQNSELRAVLNYRKALVELERNQQTTLQSLNITVIGTGGGTTATGSGSTATLTNTNTAAGTTGR